MRYRKSEELKETDIEWIRAVPEGWDIQKLKWLLDNNLEYGANESAEDENIEHPRYIRITDFDDMGSLRVDTFKSLPPKVAEDYLLQPGDILFARSGATVGKTFQFKNYDGKACYAGYLIKATPSKELVNSDYLYYFTKTKEYENWKNAIFIQATIQNISAEKYSNLILPLPPKSEQRSIAAFLDRKTEATDQLIQKKEQLIERLKEKRQALITQAVTKGLDPDVPMKDSGLMWLEEIPEHWEAHQLRRVVEKFVDYRGSTPNKIDSGIPLITAANIDDEKIDFSDVEVYISEEEYEERMVRGFPKMGDVLVTTEAPLGEVAQIEEEKVALAQRIILFKTRENLSDDFLLYYLLSGCGQSELKSRTTGSTALGIKGSKLKGIEIIVPPLQEQRKIAEFVNSESKKVFTSISKLNKQIDKLKEYRQSLISAAVTGKIDVRSTYAKASADRDEAEETNKKVKGTQSANIYFKRRVLAAKILDDLYEELTLGRRKLQKILYLLEKEIEAVELKGKYQKDAAGPFDNEMMRSIESQLKKAEWFKQVERENGYGCKYIPMIKKDEYKKYYNRYWGNINNEIEELIELLRPKKTNLLSLVATLYACWNDFLIEEKEFDGKKLIYESRHNWHEEKKKIPYKDWVDALNWMVDNNLEPQGIGELTKEKN